MALENQVILHIAYALSAAQLMVEESVDNVITRLKGFSVEYIHEKTNIDVSTLEAFLNQTLPCLYQVSKEYKNNPNATGFDSDYAMMWVKWYVV